jgi:hypothetical protein
VAIESIHCPVSSADVVRVTDLEGMTLRIVCAEYDESTHACRLKSRGAGAGPLGRLLEAAQEHRLGAHGVRCSVA